jgi:hypothetical protein
MSSASVPIILSFLLFPSILSAQSEQDHIAVLDLEGTITKEESISLTDRLVSKLIDTDMFVVVERSQMEEILREQGFQQTGCTGSECAVQIGQVLGVNRMVAGSIGKLGDMYTIGLRILDVQTGKILANVSLNSGAKIEAVVTRGIPDAVKVLVDSYERRNWTAEDIERDYQKRTRAKKASASVIASGAALCAGAGVYFWVRKGLYHDDYMSSTRKEDMDSYFSKEKSAYAAAMALSAAAIVVAPISILLFRKKIEKKTLPGVSFFIDKTHKGICISYRF